MGMSLRGVLGRIDRLASRLHESRNEDLPNVEEMRTEELEDELLAYYETNVGRPINTFASREEFAAEAVLATRKRFNLVDEGGKSAEEERWLVEFLKGLQRR
jgi:hypothetical protein